MYFQLIPREHTETKVNTKGLNRLEHEGERRANSRWRRLDMTTKFWKIESRWKSDI